MKNERGITLLVLVLTVVIMMILVATGIAYGTNSISEVRLQNFSYELQQIQGQVNAIHEKMKMDPNTEYISVASIKEGNTLGTDIRLQSEALATLYKVNTNINYDTPYNAMTEAEKDRHYANQYETIYRYFSSEDLEEIFNIKNSKRDVIINFKTREVISVKAQVHNEKPYYRLEDF